MRPFAVVDGVGFTCMVKCLNPEYTIKARNTYHAKAVVAYDQAVSGVKEMMADRNTDVDVNKQRGSSYTCIQIYYFGRVTSFVFSFTFHIIYGNESSLVYTNVAQLSGNF